MSVPENSTNKFIVCVDASTTCRSKHNAIMVLYIKQGLTVLTHMGQGA